LAHDKESLIQLGTTTFYIICTACPEKKRPKVFST